VLGTGVDRQTLFAAAQPMELAVIQLITREIEVAAQKFSGRYEDFWKQNPHMIEQARKLDQVLALVQGRRSGA
jgi:hypothetical protein